MIHGILTQIHRASQTTEVSSSGTLVSITQLRPEVLQMLRDKEVQKWLQKQVTCTRACDCFCFVIERCLFTIAWLVDDAWLLEQVCNEASDVHL